MSDQQSSFSDEQHVFEIEDAQTKYELNSLDRYQIERALGSGAMATVLLATDKILNRKVALKVPLIKSERNTEIIEKRFLREAHAAARLSHPNICPIHDVGLADGTYYISMAYIEGRTLNQIIKEAGRFGEAEAAQIVRKIASGVAEAHRQGFVHRDLKPGNIMVDQRGEPIILDFGLARFFDNSVLNQTLTMIGQTIGTPAYMSPEQAMGRRDLTPTSDIFSVGVILWELLCGERPFTGDTMEMLGKIVHGPSPSPKTKRADLSDEMETICLKAIANEPEDRFQSMEEFEQALDDVLQGREVKIASPDLNTQTDPDIPVSEAADKTRVDAATTSSRPAKPPAWIWGVIGFLLLVIVSFMVRPMFTRRGRLDLSPETVFRAGDKNQDDQLGPGELPLHIIQRADTNGDSQLSLDELRQKYKELGERLYDTPEGRPATANSFDDLWGGTAPPAPGGGAVFGKLSEKFDLTPEAVFRAGDKNQDDLLDPTELPRHVIQRADNDGDLHLSLDELRQKYEELGEALYDTPDGRPAPVNSLDDLFEGPMQRRTGFGRQLPRGPTAR